MYKVEEKALIEALEATKRKCCMNCTHFHNDGIDGIFMEDMKCSCSMYEDLNIKSYGLCNTFEWSLICPAAVNSAHAIQARECGYRENPNKSYCG